MVRGLEQRDAANPCRYVIAMKPTYFEKGVSECVEHYSWDARREQVVINYSYRSKGVDRRLPQRKAFIFNKVAPLLNRPPPLASRASTPSGG